MTEEIVEMDYATVLASAIHDMKNSLNMLLNSLDSVIQEQDAGESTLSTDHDFSQMRYEGRRVNDNLIQLLALYRMNNEQYLAQIEDHIVIDYLEETLIEHQTMFEGRGIELEVHCDYDLEWFFDHDLVTGILTNVINNLYKYTKDKVTIRAFIDDGYLVIKVLDNGPGFPQHMQYAKGDTQQGIDFNSGSTGLGLYFAQVVAGLHKNKGKKGYIITSNEGINGGGCFSLYLP